jgi:hypothetical protein
MKLDSTLKIVLPILVIVALIIALVLPWKCSAQVYRADSITVTVSYSALVDEWMTKKYGTNKWPAQIRAEWRELYKNRLSEGKEAYQRDLSIMFDFDGASGLTKADQGVLLQLKAKQDAYKTEQQRLADSTAAAAKPVGEVINTRPEIYANVGKALSPRMAFLHDVGESKPPPAPPSGLPFNEDAVITYIYVVHILAIVGLVAIGIWAIP